LQWKKEGASDKFVCPCCQRDFIDEEQVNVFLAQMKLLGSSDSPLLKLDSRNKVARKNYTQWKQLVSANVNDVMEYRRVLEEAKGLEKAIDELQETLNDQTRRLNDAKENVSEIETQTNALRDLVDSVKRWCDAGQRIADKRTEVAQAQDNLQHISGDAGGRDLKSLERDLREKQEQKEQYTNQVGVLQWSLLQRVFRFF